MEQDDQRTSFGQGSEAGTSTILPGPAHWLGANCGYAPDDLVSLQVAYDRFEVSRPDPAVAHNEVLELRIHGVGGASAEANLETPSTLMVCGDKKAGFYRAWFPGQSSRSTPQVDAQLREAYCWGKFSYAAVTSAAWLLLLPFALVNLASWALPSPHREGKTKKLEDSRRLRRLSRVLLRLLGLVLTAAFTITVCFLLVVIVGRQAAYDGSLPGWLDWYADMPSSRREAIALFITGLVVAALRTFSGFTTGRYENWSCDETLPHQTGMRLSAPDMWRGEESVRRQRFCHVFTACAVILTFAAVAFGTDSWQRQWGTLVAGAMVTFAVGVLALPGCDRLWVTQDRPKATSGDGAATGWSWALPSQMQSILEVLTWTGTLAVVVYVWFGGPDAHTGGYELEETLLRAPVLTELGVLAALFVTVSLQKPWQQADVFVRGFLSVLVAGLAVAVSSIFGGALLLTVTNVLSSPSLVVEKDAESIIVPGVVASGSLAFLFTIAAGVCVAIALFVWRAKLKRRLIKGGGAVGDAATDPWRPRDVGVVDEYQAAELPAGSPTYDGAVKKVAGIWSLSRMTELVGVVGAGLAIPTLIVLLAAEVADLTDWSRFDDLLRYAQFGSSVTVAVTVLFIGFLRAALVSEAQRRKFAFFWDVVNFWPRAAHPFAPPCYAERVVPEVTTRIRRVVGDWGRGEKDPAVGQVASERMASTADGGFEPHRPVVLNGYSQGSPISVAVMAQLPGDTHDRVALLTLACPVHRLYGRAFPLYFGPDQLETLLTERLRDHGAGRRWVNMCRRSDYVGGPVVRPAVDEWILDPPALWPESNPTRIPAHLHSDWFPDPQTHPMVDVLGKRLPRLPEPGSVGPDEILAAARALRGFTDVERQGDDLVIWSTEPPSAWLAMLVGATSPDVKVSWREAVQPDDAVGQGETISAHAPVEVVEQRLHP